MIEKSWADNPLVVAIGTLAALAGILGTVVAIATWLKIDPPWEVPKMSGNAKKESIGWIRLGAVNHESSTLQDGSPLIETTQPVTVSPKTVPIDGAQITTTTGVNLRKNPPAFPSYDPEQQERASVLNQPTKLVVLKKFTFVDPKRNSTTVVWGEVARSGN